MSTPTFSETISLSNPYTLKEKNLLIHLYEAYPNLKSKPFFRKLKLFRFCLYAIYLIANIYGLIKLSKKKHFLLNASFDSHIHKDFMVRDTNSQFCSIYFKAYSSCYEPDVTGAIELFLKNDSVFVDIGANWGHHSFIAVLNKKSKAVLFEPNPDVFNDIQRIASELDVTSAIEAHNMALSDLAGKLLLEQPYFQSGVASISETFSNSRLITNKQLNKLKKYFKLPSMSYTTEVKTLDSFSFPRIDLIKIDAEGVELEILRGAKETLQRLRPIVIFEFHSDDLSKYTDYEVFFDTLRYSLYTLECVKVDTLKDSYTLSIFPARSLIPNHPYNLLAAPVDIDFECYRHKSD